MRKSKIAFFVRLLARLRERIEEREKSMVKLTIRTCHAL